MGAGRLPTSRVYSSRGQPPHGERRPLDGCPLRHFYSSAATSATALPPASVRVRTPPMSTFTLTPSVTCTATIAASDALQHKQDSRASHGWNGSVVKYAVLIQYRIVTACGARQITRSLPPSMGICAPVVRENVVPHSSAISSATS